MTWYIAHSIMYVKFKDGIQDKYPIWENMILIEASSSDDAWDKAKIRAKEDEDSEENESLWEKRPAIFVFAGIRKIVECLDPENRPTHGTEVTYSEMELDSFDSLSKFLKGEEVLVKYHY
ncbi:DUF4288 domain-containing protein [Tumidithrix elongata RA019]|uniref:DUF4288 domain-containing protein n=1 Tax=Tumidithrix elongata BACA0141 TaxID=2716417 RepID=A0AAW9PRC8_9CYAN|nr:DUF4288 domain-containing protein [Tumidithrix elongata RA019]